MSEIAHAELDYTRNMNEIHDSISKLGEGLRSVNKKIHENPELCYKEVIAHDAIIELLLEQDIEVTPHAYGLQTAFTAEYGTGGRVVTFCAEYDALPGIGHGCGHNLIAVASIAAFFGVIGILRRSKVPGRVRLLGTPAEEGGGGKIELIKAGAFEDVHASLMIHPMPSSVDGSAGIAYGTSIACTNFRVVFSGKAAHAAATPWLGVNALDAATLGYTAISMLRQQILPTCRINISVEEGGQSPNIITDHAIVRCSVRGSTLKEALALEQRVRKCFEGAAHATACKVEFEKQGEPYSDIRPNQTLGRDFAGAMSSLGSTFLCDLDDKATIPFSTDMGNVSYVCPSFHGTFGVSCQPGVSIHSLEFAQRAGSDEAHLLAIQAGKGMAFAGWKVLADESAALQITKEFQVDQNLV